MKAQFPFIADSDGKLIALYDIKMPLVAYASRTTFVIGPDRKVLHIDTGSDAIDASKAITSCPIHKPESAAPAK